MNKREQLERDIIGAIIVNPEKLAAVRHKVKPEHFEYYRRIVDVVLAVFDKGLKVDLLNIYDVGKLPKDEVEKLSRIGPSSYNLEVLFRKLAEVAMQDEMLKLKEKITPERDAFELLDELSACQRKVENIFSAHARPDKLTILSRYIEHCQKRDTAERISTPFPTLNKMLYGGFAPGGFTLLGGRYGTGKTSLMLLLALHAAQNGVQTAFIEGEMTSDEIMGRLNGLYVGENIYSLRRDYERLVAPFVSKFFDWPFELIPFHDRTLDTLVFEIVVQAHRGAKFIFVDYLQTFKPKQRLADSYMEIRETSSQLRALALQHRVHLFVASSVNRSEAKADKLSLNSLFGSSGLEHDCSVGMILSGEQSDVQEIINPERNVVLHVVKNRSGPRGKIALKYHLDSQRFEEFTEVSERDDIFEERDNGEQAF